MTLAIELDPEIEGRLSKVAASHGQQPGEYVTHLLERELAPKEYDLDALLDLPRDRQEAIMTAAFDAAADHYNVDLALPLADRELTAFTALDGDELADFK